MTYARAWLPVALALASCGGGEVPTEAERVAATAEDAAPSPDPSPATGPQEWSDGLGTATVSGRVTYVGEPPLAEPIDLSSDP